MSDVHSVGGYTFAASGKGLIALAISGVLSIGLSLAGAYGLMFNVGDWGWLIGAATGALVYRVLSEPAPSLAPIHAGE
jgi:NCS1 family nucleobase:cation symporter-1